MLKGAVKTGPFVMSKIWLLFSHSFQAVHIGNTAIIIDFVDVVRTNIVSICGVCITGRLKLYTAVCDCCNYIEINTIININ